MKTQLDALVTSGTITSTQETAIETALASADKSESGTKTQLDVLVTNGTITAAEETAIISALTPSDTSTYSNSGSDSDGNSLTADQLYSKAFASVQTSTSTKTQKSINNARNAIASLKNTDASWAIGQLSQQVDQVQEIILVKIIDAINTAQNSVKQTDITSAKAAIDTDLPDEWKNSYSSAVDAIEQQLMKNALGAVDKAETSKLGTDITAAKILLEDIKTSTNSSIVTWATDIEAKLNAAVAS